MKKLKYISTLIIVNALTFACATPSKEVPKSKARAKQVQVKNESDDELDNATVTARTQSNKGSQVEAKDEVETLPNVSTEKTSSWLSDIKAKLDKNPNSAALWVEYGNYLLSEDKILLAEKMYEKALSFEPKNISALNNKAAIHMKKNEPELAVALLNKAYEADEFTLTPKKNLARLCLEHALYKKAISLYGQISADKRAKEADKKEASLGLAIAYLAINEFESAGKEFDGLKNDANPSFNLVYNYTRYLQKAKSKNSASAYVNKYKMRFTGDEQNKLEELSHELPMKGEVE